MKHEPVREDLDSHFKGEDPEVRCLTHLRERRQKAGARVGRKQQMCNLIIRHDLKRESSDTTSSESSCPRERAGERVCAAERVKPCAYAWMLSSHR